MAGAVSYLNQLLTTQGDGTGADDAAVDKTDITGATTASPTVVTSASHGFSDGDWVFISGATGTTEINGVRQITNSDTNTFELLDEEGAAVGSAGTFGGTVEMVPCLTIKPADGETYTIQRFLAALSDSGVWVENGFATLSTLTNGVVVKAYVGGQWYTLTNTPITSWNHWALQAGVDIAGLGDAANNKYELAVRWTFTRAGIEGIILDAVGGDNEMLVAYCLDDLNAITMLHFAVQGVK